MRGKNSFRFVLSTTAVVTALSLWFLKKRICKKRQKKREQAKRASNPKKKEVYGDEKVSLKENVLNPKTVEWYPPKQSLRSNLSANAKEFIPGLHTDCEPDEFRTPHPNTFHSNYSPNGLYPAYSSDKFQINYSHDRLAIDYPPPPPLDGQFTNCPPSETTLSVAATPFYPEQSEYYRTGKIMYIMRGLPGSGKSTLAKNLLRNSTSSLRRDMDADEAETRWPCKHCSFLNFSTTAHCELCDKSRSERNTAAVTLTNQSTPIHGVSSDITGIILSTDDFFLQKDGSYVYDTDFIVEAHRWNQQRTYAALCEGKSPIIIDNTMTQKWEAKWYVKSALKHRYKIIFVEPKTSWAKNPRKLARKNRHGVTREKIKEMLARWEDDFTIPAIINSQERNRKINVKKRRNRRRK